MYKKICILSPGRAGTKILSKSLKTHNDIVYDHEEFFGQNPVLHKKHWPFLERYGISQKDWESVDIKSMEDSLVLLKKIDISEYMDYIFEHEDMTRVLYYIYHSFPKIREYLLKRDDILIIHLTRKNLVENICSNQINYTYHTTNVLIRDPSQWPVSAKDTCHFVQFLINHERTIDIDYNSRLVKVYFENMISNWDFEIERMLEKTVFNPPIPMIGNKEYGTTTDILPAECIEMLHSTGMGWAFFGKSFDWS